MIIFQGRPPHLGDFKGEKKHKNVGLHLNVFELDFHQAWHGDGYHKNQQ